MKLHPLSFKINPISIKHEDFEIVRPVFKNNSYFAHPESIILAGATGEDEYNRKFALLEAQMNLPTNFIRVFDKSVIKLNFSALSYINMINWITAVITPPPLLLSTYYNDVEQLDVDSFKGIPCHSQPVEHCIKDVSATKSLATMQDME